MCKCFRAFIALTTVTDVTVEYVSTDDRALPGAVNLECAACGAGYRIGRAPRLAEQPDGTFVRVAA